jgi:hypothetical protein
MIAKDRNQPFNHLPDLPVEKDKYESPEILRLLGESKSKLGELIGSHGSSTCLKPCCQQQAIP